MAADVSRALESGGRQQIYPPAPIISELVLQTLGRGEGHLL